MRLPSDRIAASAAAIGAVLLVLTIITRVNPVEGSVVRPEFLQTPSGRPVAMFLLITSLPGWGGALLCAPLGSAFQSPTAVWIELTVFQLAAYWLFGKAISIGRRKWRNSRTGSA